METLPEFCPQCGTKMSAPRGAPSWLAILGIIALSLLMIPTALAGACFLLLGAGSGFSFSLVGVGALGLGLTALCILGIKKLLNK